MSAFDLSSLLTVSAPEMLAPADPPAMPEIDTSTTSTSDSNSSGSFDQTGLGLAASPTAQQEAEVGLSGGAKPATSVDSYESADEEAAAALVDLSGGSNFIIDEYEVSVPPNLAAASALIDEITSANSVSAAAVGSLYTLMNTSAALALTS